MFDGIDHVTLLTPELDALLDLYVGHLGFEEVRRDRLSAGTSYPALWGVPDGPLDVRTVEKPGATGGGLRLVGAPHLPVITHRRSMAVPGPFALDFYVRDLPALHRRLESDGHRFRSAPVSYPLFGTDFSVDEVLLEAPLGLVHAFVEYIPDRHRCVLGTTEDEVVSECVAAITVTPDVDAGLATLQEGLGGKVYFDEVFRGAVVEELIGLPDGAAFRAALLRGPERRNARAELMQLVPEAPPEPAGAVAPPVVLSIGVPDVAAAAAVLESQGEDLVGPHRLGDGPHAGHAVAAVATRWGARLELVQRN